MTSFVNPHAAFERDLYVLFVRMTPARESVQGVQSYIERVCEKDVQENVPRVAQVWFNVLKASSHRNDQKHLEMLELASLLCQVKPGVFQPAFVPLLPEAITHVYLHGGEGRQDLRNNIMQLLLFWRKRSLFSADVLSDLDTKVQQADSLRELGSKCNPRDENFQRWLSLAGSLDTIRRVAELPVKEAVRHDRLFRLRLDLLQGTLTKRLRQDLENQQTQALISLNKICLLMDKTN